MRKGDPVPMGVLFEVLNGDGQMTFQMPIP